MCVRFAVCVWVWAHCCSLQLAVHALLVWTRVGMRTRMYYICNSLVVGRCKLQNKQSRRISLTRMCSRVRVRNRATHCRTPTYTHIQCKWQKREKNYGFCVSGSDAAAMSHRTKITRFAMHTQNKYRWAGTRVEFNPLQSRWELHSHFVQAPPSI